MKKILLLGMLLFAATSYGQSIVYKSDYERATERMGVIYSTTNQVVGEWTIKSPFKVNINLKCILNTFECAETNERVQGFSLEIGQGLTTPTVYLNCTEVDDMINAVNLIQKDARLRYIARTANLRLKGSFDKGFENKIAIDMPADGSSTGDFKFYTRCFISPEELIKLFEGVKAIAD